MEASGTLLLTRREIAALMSFEDYVAAVENAFKLSAEGKAQLPGVVDIAARDGAFHIKTAGLEMQRLYVAVKINGNFPQNAGRFRLPTIQGVIALCDGERGSPLALMDSIEITINRTGAATALAARHLARSDSTVATICGCGSQGRIQLIALKHVLPIERVYAFDIDDAAAKIFAERIRGELDIHVTVVESAGEAARQSDVIVTCTTSRQPFLNRDDVHAGAFIAAVGADGHDKQELDSRLLAGNRIVTDITQQCATIGELHHAIRQGLASPADVSAELGEVIAGLKPGRTDNDEIIIFDSTGTALQDVASAALAYERARSQNIGYWCSLN
jgi:alanine dehydrogenase